jgi:hypothetical protein
MNKFYKVIKDNFLWEVGAILICKEGNRGYVPTNEIWVKNEKSDEYISSGIVENQPEYFKRVYEVNLLTKVVYKTKEQAKELLSKDFE